MLQLLLLNTVYMLTHIVLFSVVRVCLAGGFGASTDSSSGFGGFGSTTTTGFGAPAASSSSFGGFGSAPASSSAPSSSFSFGASSSSGFGGFGSAPATSGFGAPAAATTSSFGGFGSGFGSTPSTGSSLFGGFGATSTTSAASTSFSFPAASSTGSGFGGFGSSTGFGAPSTGGGLFGAPAASTSTFSGFGQPTTQQIGVQQSEQQQIARVDENPYLANFLTTSAQQLHKTAVGLSQSQALLGSSSYSSSYASPSHHNAASLSTPRTASKLTSLYPTLITPRSAARLQPRRYLPSTSTPSPTTVVNIYNNSSVYQSQTSASNISQHAAQSGAFTPELLISRRNIKKLHAVPMPPIINIPLEEDQEEQKYNEQQIERQNTSHEQKKNVTFDEHDDHDDVRAESGTSFSRPSTSPYRASSFAPVLTRPHYYTIPALSELQQLSRSQLRAVPQFTVVHDRYGSIEWEGETDVTDLNLDEIVVFEKNQTTGAVSCEIYPDGTATPPLGAKLNKPAIITVLQCFPASYTTNNGRLSETQWQKYENKLASTTEKMGAKFIQYARETGGWQFRVTGFT